MRRPSLVLLVWLVSLVALDIPGAAAQTCHRESDSVTCDDGRRGLLSGTSIIWSDGTRSHSASPHPSVIIGHKPSVQIGPGVFVGTDRGSMPLDNPNAPNKTRCAIVDNVSYCN